MTFALEPEEPDYRNYRVSFASPSLGTEEELTGPYLVVAPDAPRLIGEIRHVVTGEILVEIIRDLPLAGRDGAFTIELRTTPTERDDTDGWRDRRMALGVAVWGLENAHGKVLGNDLYSVFRTTVLYDYALVNAGPGGVIRASGRRATLGVPASGIGRNMTPSQRRTGVLYPGLTVPWYQERFRDDQGVLTLGGRERTCYAFVMSAVLRLARIAERFTLHVGTAEAKNAWGVRPRTAPVTLIESFPSEEAKTTVRVAMASRNIPSWAGDSGPEPSGHMWAVALDHVLRASPMGGRLLPDSTVAGTPAMLFEYRAPGPDQFPDAFWAPDEDHDFPDTPDDVG